MTFLPINLLNVQAAAGYDYPLGSYLFEVESYEVRTNTDGEGQRLLITNKILMGPGAGNNQYTGRKMSSSYQISEKGAPFMKKFFIVCGVSEEFINQNGGQVDPEWLLGRTYCATVGKKNNFLNIGNEKPATEWANVPPAQKTAAPAGAAAPSLLQPNAPQMGTPPVTYAQPQQQQFAPPAQFAPQAAPQQMAPAQPQYAPAGLPTPQLPMAQGGIPVGIPAPVPPPGRVG